MKQFISKVLSRKIEILYSLAFSSMLVFGHMLSNYKTIDLALPSPRILAMYGVFFIVTTAIIMSILLFLKKILLNKKKVTRKKNIHNKYALKLMNLSPTKQWLAISCAIYMFYLPIIILAHVVLSYDSWMSIQQSTGVDPLTDHHPVIFTFFVGLFAHIGLAFNNLEMGLILFSLVQSAILAAVFGRVIQFIYNEGASKGFILLAFIFYAILPVNAMAGIVMWKDIIFTGLGLLFLIEIIVLYRNRNKYFTLKNYIYFTAIVFLFCALRHNALYVYVVFSILFIFSHRRHFLIKKLSLLLGLPVVLYVMYSAVISQIAQPVNSLPIALIVPIQQVSRTVTYNNVSLSSSDKEVVAKVMPYESLAELYNPTFADPIRDKFKADVFKEDPVAYLETWFKMAMDNKKIFIFAFLYNTYGYVYPMYVSNSPTDILLNNYDQKNTPENYKNPIDTPSSKRVVEAYRDGFGLAIPYMNNIGLYILLVILTSYIAIVRRKKELIGPFIILGGMFVTVMLFGSINSEFRYLYIFCAALPLILGVALYGNRKY